MYTFPLLVLCLAVLGVARATLDKDTSPNNNEAVDTAFTPVESRVVPPDNSRGLWAGGNAISGIYDELMWTSESGWGASRVYNKCSDDCM